MDALARIETRLELALAFEPGGPPLLAAAIRHAVFPGGMRVRPRLCLAVADACGGAEPGLAEGIAASIELLHCASLVHDDLPCFDDAALRRGAPSVQRQFGTALAVLAGDALIVLGFETLARSFDAGTAASGARLATLVSMLARASGMPGGLVAGQAWECEKVRALDTYQRAKTASLFALATEAGAIAAGADHAAWRRLGEMLGEAYQIADDIRDATLSADELGKPAGQDDALDRPSAARELGHAIALDRVASLVHDAIAAIPPCARPHGLRALILGEMRRLLPAGFAIREAA